MAKIYKIEEQLECWSFYIECIESVNCSGNYLKIKSFILTLKKQNKDIFDSLVSSFDDKKTSIIKSEKKLAYILAI